MANWSDSFTLYRRPSAVPIVLTEAPRLANWDKNTTPGQQALRRYLQHVDDVAGGLVNGTSGPLSIELSVDIEPTLALLSGGRDVDNFLQPVVDALGRPRFASAWVRKGHIGRSSIAVGHALPLDLGELTGWSFACAETDASTSRSDWKRQFQERLSPTPGHEPDGPIELHVAYALSPQRNWSGPWKATIDALGPILGVPNPGHPYHTNDDRVTRLAFHRNLDETIGWKIRIGVWWRRAPKPE
jgi:hypothetical protein